MLHRYVMIGGEFAGQSYQGRSPRHTPDGFICMARQPKMPSMAFTAENSAPPEPALMDIDQVDYLIVATEAYTDGEQEIGIYYAIPAKCSPSDALLFLSRYANRLQNFAVDVKQQNMHQPHSRAMQTLEKFGLNFNLI